MAVNAFLQQLIDQAKRGELSDVPPPAPSMPIGLNVPANPYTGGGPIGPMDDVPIAPADPAIARRFMDAAGPAPVAPVQRAPSTLEKIGAILSGIGGGPQVAQQIREEREAPFRRYDTDKAAYDERRANLQLRGELATQEDIERRTARAERLEDQRYARRFAAESRRLGLVDDESRARLAHSLEIERDAIRATKAERAELAREMGRRRDDARSIAGRLSDGPGAAPPAIAKELGDYLANLIDELSPTAARWRSAQVRRYEQLTGGGGGRRGVSNAAMRALGAFNGALQEVIGASQRGDVRGERAARRKLDAMHGRLSQYPAEIEAGIGEGGWPYAKLKGQAAPAPGGVGSSVQATGDRQSPARAQALLKLIGAGFSGPEAEAELNRLGIK